MELIKHLEELSMLEFSADEKESFKTEFDQVLEFVSQIEKINLDEEMDKQLGLALEKFRDDEVQDSLDREDALLNAPCAKDGCYLSPLVID